MIKCIHNIHQTHLCAIYDRQSLGTSVCLGQRAAHNSHWFENFLSSVSLCHPYSVNYSSPKTCQGINATHYTLLNALNTDLIWNVANFLFSSPTVRRAEGLLHLDCVIYLKSIPVIGRCGSVWLYLWYSHWSESTEARLADRFYSASVHFICTAL